MLVNIYNKQKKWPIDDKVVDAIVHEVLKKEKRSCDEVNIHFIGTKKICSLHQMYFNDPSITDCISFPIDSDSSSGYQILGEVFVCPNTAASYVAKHGGDIYEEITLYTIHGMLHLLGYNDLSDDERLIMRKKEALHMANLRKKKLLLQQKKQRSGRIDSK